MEPHIITLDLAREHVDEQAVKNLSFSTSRRIQRRKTAAFAALQPTAAVTQH
jgi:hypothetical protein